MKLALGTVQFGMDYGVSNQFSKTSLREVTSILKYASENEIEILDTACTYGDSERVLGMALPKEHDFRIITKTPVFRKKKISIDDAEKLKSTLINSLKNLGQSKVAGLLIHYAEDLFVDGGELLFVAMQELKEKGLIDAIGVSICTGEQIDVLLEKYDLDIFQLPINILDQRLINSGHIAKLKEKDVEIHARSVFLQGLLLIDPELLHSYFTPIKPLLYEYRNFLSSQCLIPIEGALGFVKGISGLDYVVIGVNNLKQLENNLISFNKSYKDFSFSTIKRFSTNDPKYLNPSLWKLN